MTEAYVLVNTVENGLRTRVFIIDMWRQLKIRQWKEKSTSAVMEHVWITDYESLFVHLIPINTKQVDSEHLTIDLSTLKQLIWHRRDDCDEESDDSKNWHVYDTYRLLNVDHDILSIEWIISWKYARSSRIEWRRIRLNSVSIRRERQDWI